MTLKDKNEMRRLILQEKHFTRPHLSRPLVYPPAMTIRSNFFRTSKKSKTGSCSLSSLEDILLVPDEDGGDNGRSTLVSVHLTSVAVV